MAYTKDDFLKDLALYSAGGIIGVTRTRKMLQYAGRKGIQIAGLTARRAAPAVGRAALSVAKRNPLVAVGGVLYALNEAGYLEEVKAVGREANLAGMEAVDEELIQPAKAVVKRAKKRVNNFSKAVGIGVKAVRSSKFQGKKGKLSNAKKTLSTVSKTVAKVKAGKKVITSGVSGVIKRALRGIKL